MILQAEKKGDVKVASLTIKFQDKKFFWPHQYITGAELKKLFGLKPEQELLLSRISPWDDQVVANEETINLARPGTERFYIRVPLEFKIDGKTHIWEKPTISGAELRTLAGVEEGDEVWLTVSGPYDDELVRGNGYVDLTRPGLELFYIVKQEVAIRINDIEFKIRRGTYNVTDLKKIGGVEPSHEIDSLKDHKLIPLDDSAIVVIKGGEQFISHVRDGSSS